jgi:REP element-mobilizing transposase RayT
MASTLSDQRTKTEPITGWEVSPEVTFEPLSMDPYELSYACLLIPRFSTHALVGDLEDNLYPWMEQICISFSWKLDYLNVRPEYLQWIMRVPPATSPGYFMNIIRQQTSQDLLKNFPRFKKEIRSTDFWAPGYLVIVSISPHPPKMIQDFIKYTRQQQGIFRGRD